MNKLFDLRFVIGSFFTIIGLILLVYGFFSHSDQQEAVNKWCGIIFTIFGALMIILSLRKDAADELLEEEPK